MTKPKDCAEATQRITARLATPKCLRCNQHFSGAHLCAADHEEHCDIRTSRDGWDADCNCKRGRP